MSNIAHHPHDKLVAKFLKDPKVAIDLLKSHLPTKTLEKLDLSTLQVSSETAVTQKWKKYHNDIVFHCKTKDQRDAYIYMLIEHVSTPKALLPVIFLRYKLNVLSTYLDAKNPPRRLPNIISLVIYHGEGKYPYPKDVFSCFEDRELAFKDITEPMLLLDLTDTPEDALISHGGADTVLKLLLKYSRERDFVKKMESLMASRPDLFVSLSLNQAGYMYEYTMFIGQGTPENAKTMENAIQRIYGGSQAKKIFSLADYYKQEARKEGLRLGITKGRQEGRQEGRIEIAKQMLARGIRDTLIREVTGLSLEEMKSL